MTAVLPDAGPIRIFIADDVDRVRQAVRDLLELQPDIVVVGDTADPTTARAQIPQAHPDVVLLDAHMHGEASLPLVRAVRAMTPRVPVVIYAANPRPGEREAALAAGAAVFLAKDVLPHDLLDILRQVANRGTPPNRT
jgi:two-component system, NarL family, response regulator DevR